MTARSIFRSPAGQRAVMQLYAEMLKHWPVPHEVLTLDTRHGHTCVVVSGPAQAPPLLLLHGSSSNAMSWLGDVTQLSRCFRVYAVDLVGEPGRSAEHRPSWRGPAWVQWFDDVLHGLHLDRVFLLGMSQGGWTAVKFAVHQPQRVERLVLVSPGGIIPTRAAYVKDAVALSRLGAPGAQQLSHMLLGPRPASPLVLHYMTTMLTHTRARRGREVIFSDAQLARLTMPVLLLGGAHDVTRSMDATAARLRLLLPGLQVCILPGVGHVPLNMAPAVLEFLQGG